MCTASLAPIDWFLQDKFVMEVLDFFALQVCEKMKIEGGMPSVCKGAIDMMSAFLLPALAKGPLSPQTLCDE